MKVIHLSVECYPVAKVGGLADVVGSLPKYQRKLGIDASVVMPWYDREFVHTHVLDIVHEGSFYQGSELLVYKVWKESKDVLGFPLYLIQIPGKLDRPEVYSYADEAHQWISFQHAFLDWLSSSDNKPDLINCHDHHVGLIPFLLQHALDFKNLAAIRTVFTVHNGQYQGWMNWNMAHFLPRYDTWRWGLLDWDGVINPMAAGIKCAHAYTTVSEGYLEELYIEANGLQDLFSSERAKSLGIVNGIDTDYWNPEIDKYLPFNYTASDIKQGKGKNKEAFCQKMGLPSGVPLLSYIGRFAFEKGADILPDVVRKIYSSNENEIAIFILGSGDEHIQSDIEKLLDEFPMHVRVFFGYNESLAHEVYAASDMLIMPSRVEPCGLNQLYALKYGTVPIVRNIGGLRDTVLDADRKGGYGFVFDDLETTHILDSIHRAIIAYANQKKWVNIQKKAINLDYSWGSSAQKYINLYNQLVK